MIHSGEQTAQTHSVMPLGQNAREIRASGVKHDDEVTPPWIPEKKQRGERQRAPMAQLAAAGFPDESLQIDGVGSGQRALGKTAGKPCCRVRQAVFPFSDMKKMLVKPQLCREFLWWIKPAHWHVREQPCQA